jgi:enamine deaminase RidA (YjgF/YER057c/UK114 family)
MADDRGNTRIIPAESQKSYDNFHFAPAVIDGANVRLSGVIGTGPDGKTDPDPDTQFTQAFETIGRVLEAAGVGFADITDITSYHMDLHAHIGNFMRVKDQFVKAPYPAWTAVGTTALAMPGALAEIKIIARKQ